MLIYLITNRVNGKQYVGQTTQPLEKRMQQHARCNKLVVGKAIQKYGRENFTVTVLEVCRSQDELDTMERHYIQLLATKSPRGYNQNDGGNGGRPSAEARARFSESARASRVGRKSGHSQFKGVSFVKKDGKWSAQFCAPGSKVMSLGCYETEEEAALVYDAAVLAFAGPAAYRNFPDSSITRSMVPYVLHLVRGKRQDVQERIRHGCALVF